MHVRKRPVTISFASQDRGSDHGDPAPYRARELGKRVERRKPVANDGSDQCSQIRYEGVYEGREECAVRPRGGDMGRNERGRTQQQAQMDSDTIGLASTEHLVGDLG